MSHSIQTILTFLLIAWTINGCRDTTDTSIKSSDSHNLPAMPGPSQTDSVWRISRTTVDLIWQESEELIAPGPAYFMNLFAASGKPTHFILIDFKNKVFEFGSTPIGNRFIRVGKDEISLGHSEYELPHPDSVSVVWTDSSVYYEYIGARRAYFNPNGGEKRPYWSANFVIQRGKAVEFRTFEREDLSLGKPSMESLLSEGMVYLLGGGPSNYSIFVENEGEWFVGRNRYSVKEVGDEK